MPRCRKGDSGRASNCLSNTSFPRANVPFGEEGSPLDERVGRHLQTVSMLIEVFSSYNPDRTIAVENLPTLQEVMERGLGAYLAPPGG